MKEQPDSQAEKNAPLLTTKLLAQYLFQSLVTRPHLVEQLNQIASQDSFSFQEPLSARELEVLRLLAAGASNREILSDLSIALNTARKHVSNIFGKLGGQKPHPGCLPRLERLA